MYIGIFIYDSYDRLTDQKLDSTIYAHLTYDAYSRIDNVTYPAAGQQKVTYTRESTTSSLGRLTGLAYTKGDGTQGPADSVTRSTTGDITSGTENGVSKAYQYDTAGRLTAATLGTTTYGYSYAAPTSIQCPQTSANLNAHKSSNRTSSTITGLPATTYCYDQADRLIASSDPTIGAPGYDDHGNTTVLGAGSTSQLEFAYSASDQNVQVLQINTQTAAGTVSQYERDAANRTTKRKTFTISNWNWSQMSEQNYGYTGAGDAPDFIRDSSWTITEKYLSLPGDVLLTIRPGATTPSDKTYSLPNIHGDVFATTNATGAVLGTYITGPFGERLNITGANQTAPQSISSRPNNTSPNSTYHYTGQHQKLTETAPSLDIIQMGARVYIPSLGRFAQTDPVQGGTPNSYVYPTDPVNSVDITGTAEQKLGSWGWWGSTLKDFAKGVYEQPIFGLKTLVVDPVKQMTKSDSTASERAGAAGMLLLNVTPAGKGAKAGKLVFGGLKGIKAADLALAKRFGYSKQLASRSHGQTIYTSKNGRSYITRDIDSHRGGYWKRYVKRGGQWVREGTYTQNMIRIGK